MKRDVLQFIWDNQTIDVPTLQKQFHLSYSDARNIIAELAECHALHFDGVISYEVVRSEFCDVKCDDGAVFSNKTKDKFSDATTEYNSGDDIKAFYKEALFFSIKRGRASSFEMIRRFEVTPSLAFGAYKWMYDNNYIDRKDNGKALINEEQFFALFGKSDFKRKNFKDLYLQALSFCIDQGSFDIGAIGRAFVCSTDEVKAFFSWAEHAGYKKSNKMNLFITREQFDAVYKYGKQEELNDFDNLEDILFSLDDGDLEEDDDELDELDDDEQEEAINKILQEVTDKSLDSLTSSDSPDKTATSAAKETASVIKVYKNDALNDKLFADFDSDDTRDNARKHALAMIVSNKCKNLWELITALDLTMTQFYNILYWLYRNHYVIMEPLLLPQITAEDFTELFGDIIKYNVEPKFADESKNAEHNSLYTDEFLDLCKASLLYCIRARKVSLLQLNRDLVHDFKLTYTVAYWMHTNGYIYERILLLNETDFKKKIGETEKYDKVITERGKNLQDYYDLLNTEPFDVKLANDKLSAVKSILERNLHLIPYIDEKNAFIATVDTSNTFHFRLRSDGARIYLSDTGWEKDFVSEECIERVLNSFDIVECLDDEFYVSFVDPDYAMSAFMTLFAATKMLKRELDDD